METWGLFEDADGQLLMGNSKTLKRSGGWKEKKTYLNEDEAIISRSTEFKFYNVLKMTDDLKIENFEIVQL